MKKFLFMSALVTGTMSACTAASDKAQKVEEKAEKEVISDHQIQSAPFVCENDVEWESLGEGLKRQILGYDGKIMMVKIVAEQAGPVGVAHAHPHSQTTFVSSGKFEFTIGEEKRVVTAGDGLYMAPDVMHSCICIEPGVIVDCFSPVREDFLKK